MTAFNRIPDLLRKPESQQAFRFRPRARYTALNDTTGHEKKNELACRLADHRPATPLERWRTRVSRRTASPGGGGIAPHRPPPHAEGARRAPGRPSTICPS